MNLECPTAWKHKQLLVSHEGHCICALKHTVRINLTSECCRKKVQVSGQGVDVGLVWSGCNGARLPAGFRPSYNTLQNLNEFMAKPVQIGENPAFLLF